MGRRQRGKPERRNQETRRIEAAERFTGEAAQGEAREAERSQAERPRRRPPADLIEQAQADDGRPEKSRRKNPVRPRSPDRRLPERVEGAVRQERHIRAQRRADPPVFKPVHQPEGIGHQGAHEGAGQSNMPGQPVSDADAEVVDQGDRHNRDKEQRLGKPSQAAGQEQPGPRAKPRRAMEVNEHPRRDEHGQPGQEEIEIAGLQ